MDRYFPIFPSVLSAANSPTLVWSILELLFTVRSLVGEKGFISADGRQPLYIPTLPCLRKYLVRYSVYITLGTYRYIPK